MPIKGLPLRIPDTLASSSKPYLSGIHASIPPWHLGSTPDLPSVISTLQCCTDIPDSTHAKLLHTYICGFGLDTLASLGNHIIQMFVSCGNVLHAQHIFDRSHHQSMCASSCLITGLIECGNLKDALCLYYRMRDDGDYVLLTLLKSCTRLKAMERGGELHDHIIQKGLEQDVYIGSTLIDMYAKCGAGIEARYIFDNMCNRNVVSWNALIAGYVDHEPSEEAFVCYHQMQNEGVAVDAVTFTCILKACHSAINTGKEIHTYIMKIGLDREVFVGSSLLSMYAKYGLLEDACKVFDKLHNRDAVSWTTLLSGFAEHGAGQEVFKQLEEMRKEGISPTPYVYACSLKACSSIEMFEKGLETHIEVVKKGCEGDIYVGSSLIDMYAKHGSLFEAQKVLDEMPVRNSVSWNALIAGYAEHVAGEKALECHEKMLMEHLPPDEVTLACCLKSCASVGVLEKGHMLHAETMYKGLENDLLIGTALVDMYANFGFLLDAQKVFNKMAVRSVVSWNVLMAGYGEHGTAQQTWKCYEEMKLQGISPSAITLSCLLESCGNIADLENGRKAHSEVTEKGFESDDYVGNVLVYFYAKNGSLAEAQQIFVTLPLRSPEAWTAMISGYAEYEWSSEALNCFEQMKIGGIFLDAVVFVCVLKACGSKRALKKVQESHLEILKRGFERDPFVGITLVDVYCKCGLLSDGHKAFNVLTDQSVVAWNALIGGYSEHGPAHIAIKCYDEMRSQNISPSIVTYVSVLKACTKVGAIDKGREVHMDLRQKGFEVDPFVVSSLIVLYAGCGSLPEAWQAFDKLHGPSVVSWNAMLKGLGINHKGDVAVCLFKEMQQQGVKPNIVTFTCLLATCSRVSLIADGRKYFQTMMNEYNIVPMLEHLVCMVDVLARSGHIYQADKLFESLPHLPSKVMWTVLLSACQTYAEVELGERCFEQLVGMEREFAAPYALMASIYANAGRWEDVKRIEELRKLTAAKWDIDE